jgi:hypothetical protein
VTREHGLSSTRRELRGGVGGFRVFLACLVLGVGTRENMGGADSGWGAYTVNEAAQRHGAGVEEETTDAAVAYASYPERKPTRYRDGWLPD